MVQKRKGITNVIGQPQWGQLTTNNVKRWMEEFIPMNLKSKSGKLNITCE